MADEVFRRTETEQRKPIKVCIVNEIEQNKSLYRIAKKSKTGLDKQNGSIRSE